MMTATLTGDNDRLRNGKLRGREEMTFYFRVVKTIFYERAQRVSKYYF
jgi:hypothetical protein